MGYASSHAGNPLVIERRARSLRGPQLCGLLAMLVGSLVTLGWHFDIELLKQPIRGSVPVNPTTAACFIALGLVLSWPRRLVQPRLGTHGLRLLAGAVVAVGAIKLLDLAAGSDTGIDRYLLPASWPPPSPSTTTPWRPTRP